MILMTSLHYTLFKTNCFRKKKTKKTKGESDQSEADIGQKKEKTHLDFTDKAIYMYQFSMWLSINLQMIFEAEYQ